MVEGKGLIELSHGEIGGAEVLLVSGIGGIGLVGFLQGREGFGIVALLNIKGGKQRLGGGEAGFAVGERFQLREGFVGFSVGEQMLDGGEFAGACAEALCGDSRSDQGDCRDGDDEGEASAARGFGSSCRGEKRSNSESHDKATDVRGVADARDGLAEGQVVKDKSPKTAENVFVELEMSGSFFQVDKRNENAGQSEDGARCAGSGGLGMPVNASNAAEDAAGEVGEEVAEAAEKALGRAAKIPQAPHVEAEVNEPEVDEHAGDEAPPLSAESERAEVGPEGNGLLRSGIESGDSAEDHDGEDQDACGDEHDGDEESCGRKGWLERGQRRANGL